MAARRTGMLLVAALAGMLAICAVASPAIASPAWKFNGSSGWGGSEEVVDHALEGSLAMPGLTVTCEPFVYVMKIENVSGTGVGSVVNVPLSNCFTDTICTVESIAAEGLPWPAKLLTVSGTHYLLITKIEFTIVFGNPLCALYETEVVIDGSAGGRIDNPSESAVFDASSFSATGAKLLAFGSPVALSGTFRMAAIGPRIGESLTVG